MMEEMKQLAEAEKKKKEEEEERLLDPNSDQLKVNLTNAFEDDKLYIDTPSEKELDESTK